MVDFDIDTRKLDAFKRELDDFQRLFPKETYVLMRKSGLKARAIVARKARQLIGTKTGNYYKSIKGGRPWRNKSEDMFKVRVYSGAPHAHLIEYGHRIVGKEPDKKEHGFKEGYHVFDKATKDIESQWEDILEREFDKIMIKL